MSENTNTSNKKSTILQAVKAIAVLVIICLVCCIFLAVFNDLLYISEDVSLERNLQKIYPGFSMQGKLELNDEFKSNPVYGEVLGVWASTEEGSYVLKTKGTGGFKSGSVTIYVGVKNDYDFSTAKKEPVIVGWAIDDNEGQSFIGNVSQKYQSTWYVGEKITTVQEETGRGSGASYTENAINNAINMAGYYCMNALGLGSNPEGDAKKAVLALLSENGVEATINGASNVLNAKIGTETVASKLSDSANTISYYFVGGNVQVFVYGEDDGRKIVALCGNNVIKSANVGETDEFVANIQQNTIHIEQLKTQSQDYTAYAMILGVSEDGSTYTVAGLAIATTPSTYILEVVISNDGGAGKVQSITATKNGFVDGQPAQSKTDLMLSNLVGATAATILGTYNSNAESYKGASESANLITVAVSAALADFDAKLASAE